MKNGLRAFSLAARPARPVVVPPGDPRDRGGPAQPLLLVESLRKYFPVSGGVFNRRIGDVKAVDGISFAVFKGETLGVVGESGCGKSTLARLVVGLIPSNSGSVVFDGDPVGGSNGLTLRELRRNLQIVFQDSDASLNPRLPVEESIAYGPRVHGVTRAAAKQTAHDLLRRVGLRPDLFASRYPHELSGGQKQRVNIARALALSPRMLILDEAVSALDKSIEAQVLNLLRYLKSHFNLTYIFISHDLNVVHYIADRVMVMYLGQVVEIGPADAIYSEPKHPYTRALLDSRLAVDPIDRIEAAPLTGDPPNPITPPSGCRFRTRCAFAEDVCTAKAPALGGWRDPAAHLAACHMADRQSGHSRAGQTLPATERPLVSIEARLA
ncbi:MAG TPA: oligopeptide/dipeptide ABC transporter ATP-binding protein [Stellaceae bacterium]|nr:oligopeptide/dipeptide ABC transporter ATP-binding protein [Stellaceae bacterium]